MNKEKEFWDWFAENQATYLPVNATQDVDEKELILQKLLEKIHDYQHELYFEIGGHRDGSQELIITSEGNAKLFDKVETLVAAAPELKDWTVVALKPPMGTDFKVNYEGVELDPTEMWFLPLRDDENPGKLGLQLGIDGYDETKEKFYLGGSVMILESILGEKSFSLDVHYIELVKLAPSPAENGFIELVKLPEFIEWKEAKQTKPHID